MSDITLTAYKIPLSAVARWPEANYTSGERRYWFLPFSISIGLTSLAIIVARLLARRARTGIRLGADDVLIVLAWIFSTALIVNGAIAVCLGGFDRHIWDVPPKMAEKGALMTWITELVFLWASFLTKLSVLLYYRRFISTAYSSKLTRAIYIAGWSNFACLVAFHIFSLTVCKPISANWTSFDISVILDYKCVDRRAADIAVGITSLVTDIYALIIPQIVIVNLQVSPQKKLKLAAIFGSSLVILGAAIARTYWFARLHTDPRRDLPWIGHDILAWGLLEVEAGIICASIPSIWALATKRKTDTTNQSYEKKSSTLEQSSYTKQSVNQVD